MTPWDTAARRHVALPMARPASLHPMDPADRRLIGRVAERYAKTSPVMRSKRRSLDVAHALHIGPGGVQWFYDRRDGYDVEADHAHAMTLLPTGELVDLTARQFDPLADYPLIYPNLAATGRDWKRYQLKSGLAMDPTATAELPFPPRRDS